MKVLKLVSLILASATFSACSSNGGDGIGAGSAKTPDGEKINLTLSPKGSVAANTDYGYLRGQNNNSSFYGVWVNDAQTIQELRYQGTPATYLPRGSATYIGDAVWVSGFSGKMKQGGTTLLQVDFDNKTVEGKIEFTASNDNRTRDITLHRTNLNGTSFSGKASVLFNSSGSYKGGLFGEAASEAAGIVTFKDSTLNLNTAFGGKRR